MKRYRKLFPLLAILLLLLNMLFPLASAAALSWNMKEWDVEPWEVDPWEEDTWEKDQWKLEQSELKEWVVKPGSEPKKWTPKPWVVREWEMKLKESSPSTNGPGSSNGESGNNPNGSPNVESGNNPNGSPNGESGNNPNGSPSGEDRDNPGGNSNGNEGGGKAGETGDNQAGESDDGNGSKVPDWVNYLGNDVIGSTVNFADTMTRPETAVDLTNGDYSSVRGHFTDLLYASGKLAFGNNEWAEAGFAVTDTIKAGATLYEEAQNFNLLQKANALRQAGSIDDALNVASNAKTLSRANAIVSTALLPLSIYDTVHNIREINNTTGQAQTDAIFDTVGSVGSTLSGLAAPVAMLPIPGAQIIAAGLLTVGAAASLVSLGYSLYRNERVRQAARAVGKFVSDGAQKIGKGIANAANAVADTGKKVFSAIGSLFGG